MKTWEAKERRAHFTEAHIAAILANVYRDSSKSARSFSPADFLPIRPEPRVLTIEETEAAAAAFFGAIGAQNENGKEESDV